MSNSFGQLFRVTTFGESHGPAMGCVVDGCPPGLELSEADIQPALDRRRPGQGVLTTERDESDQVEILSGLRDGLTLGTPLAFLVRNQDQRPAEYADTQTVPRPSHADFTYQAKYGIQAASGGGRASARETLARVAAGAVAEKLLRVRWGVEIVAWVDAVGAETAEVDSATVTRDEVDAHEVRCPQSEAAERFAAEIQTTRAASDSVGGVVACVVRGLPAGLGEPVFAKTEALLAGAMLSLPASKGFEIGSGFKGSRMRGSTHNDPFADRGDGTLGTVTNHSGGVQGGITNGEPIQFRVAFKPPATIGLPQQTVDYEGHPVILEVKGRHDPCVVPRAVPIVEAMAALVLADLVLFQNY
ncbi:MAG: chorismate synthase [Gemmatimonadales bacterium]|nr:chorismate synthase [Gemmatimonadales bacterium]